MKSDTFLRNRLRNKDFEEFARQTEGKSPSWSQRIGVLDRCVHVY